MAVPTSPAPAAATLTREELREIQQRADAATPAPWEGQHYNLAGLVDSFGVEAANDLVICAVEKAKLTVEQAADNALFIAHARADIPRLLAHAAALAAEVERLTPALGQREDSYGTPMNHEQFDAVIEAAKSMPEDAAKAVADLVAHVEWQEEQWSLLLCRVCELSKVYAYADIESAVEDAIQRWIDTNPDNDDKMQEQIDALKAEVARLADAERRLLPQTADGYSIGLGSSIWGLFESEDGDRFWAVAEVTATYESTCERTIDAQMIIDRDTRIECEPACHFAYAHHPETDQPASEARAAFDAARGASDA